MIESSPVFVDGFGRRVVRVSHDDPPVELLQIDAALAEHPGFAEALRERVKRFSSLRLTSYARTARVETDAQGGLTLVSEYVKGWRLADLLDVAEAENLTFDIGVVMLLLRQLLPTAAMLSNQKRETASGALGPEHLLLTPQGRIVLTDYTLGTAIETLGWDADRLWARLRVATPPAGSPDKTISPRGDTAQIGVTLLSLVVGRRLRDDEFPERLDVLVGSARQRTPTVVDAPLSEGLRTWLRRALQLDTRSFGSLHDARRALEQLLATESSLIAQPMELDVAMSRLERLMPVVELPSPPVAPSAPPLLDMPAPTHDWALPAVAFDTPPASKGVELGIGWQTGSTAAVAVAPEPIVAPPLVTPMPAVAARALDAPAPLFVREPVAPPPPAPVPTPAAAVVAPPVAAPVVDATAPPFARPVAAPDEYQRLVEGLRTTAKSVTATVAMPPPEPEPAAATPFRSRFDEADPVETTFASTPPVDAVPWWRSARAVAAMAALVLLQGGLLAWQFSRTTETLTGEGELVVQSRPEGARVTIDDEDRGVTPLTVRVSPGTHVLQVKAGTAEPRVIPLMIRAGTQTAQYVELQGVSTTGVLEVRSEPSAARVTIDGQARGSTPLTLRDVRPGDYQVVLERAGWKSTQVVRVEPGTIAQLVVPIR
jgi:hypothetical protein